MGEALPSHHPALESARAEIVPFLQFDREIRTIICTTNALESINARLRRAVTPAATPPPERAALECLYLALMSSTPAARAGPVVQPVEAALKAFDISFDGRLSAGRK